MSMHDAMRMLILHLPRDRGILLFGSFSAALILSLVDVDCTSLVVPFVPGLYFYNKGCLPVLVAVCLLSQCGF